MQMSNWSIIILVNYENSLVFYQALKDKGVEGALHIYPEGGHGFGLAVGMGYLQTWTDRLADWMDRLTQNDPTEEDWQPMFNGKDFTGWDIHIAGHEIDDNYKNTFVVAEDMVRIKYDEYEKFDNKFGHMYYEQPMEYYKMRLGDSTWIHIVEGDTVMVYEHPRLDANYISKGNPLNWESAHVEQSPDFIERADELIKGGYIALQAESHPIDFKDVEILNLKGCMDKKATNYKAYFVKADNELCKY